MTRRSRLPFALGVVSVVALAACGALIDFSPLEFEQADGGAGGDDGEGTGEASVPPLGPVITWPPVAFDGGATPHAVAIAGDLYVVGDKGGVPWIARLDPVDGGVLAQTTFPSQAGSLAAVSATDGGIAVAGSNGSTGIVGVIALDLDGGLSTLTPPGGVGALTSVAVGAGAVWAAGSYDADAGATAWVVANGTTCPPYPVDTTYVNNGKTIVKAAVAVGDGTLYLVEISSGQDIELLETATPCGPTLFSGTGTVNGVADVRAVAGYMNNLGATGIYGALAAAGANYYLVGSYVGKATGTFAFVYDGGTALRTRNSSEFDDGHTSAFVAAASDRDGLYAAGAYDGQPAIVQFGGARFGASGTNATQAGIAVTPVSGGTIEAMAIDPTAGGDGVYVLVGQQVERCSKRTSTCP